jgi:hypothetical protein
VDNFEEWREFVKELKDTWRTLWRDRIDDHLRAEGIADKDYSKLFVEKGLIVVATRDYKPLNLGEIIEQYMTSEIYNAVSPSPSVGGWRKFVRDAISKQKSDVRRRPTPMKAVASGNQQLKKGGRGWIHRA